jgi:hypothetical protein
MRRGVEWRPVRQLIRLAARPEANMRREYWIAVLARNLLAQAVLSGFVYRSLRAAVSDGNANRLQTTGACGGRRGF